MRRVIFFGMSGEFSLIALRAMLSRGVNVVAVVTFDSAAPADTAQQLYPQPLAELPLLPRNIISLAHDHNIPAFAISSFGDSSFVRDLQPDLICVACFPKLFPKTWLAIPKLGCLNLHPSLLPNYRGIAPLFWQFYYGETRTGVTLHFMDTGADTGDIVSQTEVPFSDGITSHEADRLTANAGAELLINAVTQNSISRRPQSVRTLHKLTPLPKPKDRLIPTSWSARRAFNFIRGADEWGYFEIDVNGKRIRVRETLGFKLGGKIQSVLEEKGVDTYVQFFDGVLIIR